jgi:predicted nucleic acid-binding protein
LPIEIETTTQEQILVSVRRLVSQYRLTAYDAAYLEVAIRHRVPVAAFDNALARAATDAGSDLVKL